MKNFSQAGFTFVEIILAILLLAIVVPPLLNLFANITMAGVQSDVIPQAASLAVELMEEIKSRQFDELTQKDGNGNWSTTLGTDAGESAANKATFDDVDDFNGWTQNFGSGLAQYTATVTVAYVASNDLNTALVIPQNVPSNWTPSYKRIVVSVSHPTLSAPIKISTVVTEVQFL